MGYTVFFTTLGCKVNQYDSGALMDLFRANGFEPYVVSKHEGYGSINGDGVSEGIDEDTGDGRTGRSAGINPAGASEGSENGRTGESYEAEPDVIVVNTCIVTAESERKSRQAIRRLRARYPKALLAAVGCYPQQYPEKASGIEGVDFIAGVSEHATLVKQIVGRIKSVDEVAEGLNIDRFGMVIARLGMEERTRAPDGVHTAREGMEERTRAPDGVHTAREGMEERTRAPDGVHTAREGMEERTRAYVKIQDGCDNYCSYCIVPYVRGRARSRNMPDIINEVDAVLSGGAPEIVLTGTHISSYRYDNVETICGDPQGESTDKTETICGDPQGESAGTIYLGNLIGVIAGRLSRQIRSYDIKSNSLLLNSGSFLRLRLSSLEPTVVTPRFVKSLLDNRDVLCPHFHLSLQSGSDAVLRQMNRKYTTDRFFDAVSILREAFPDAGITTDIIAGFPGETDDEFAESYEFCKKVAFSKMHVFPYSKRPGTRAADFAGQIDKHIKRDRVKRLITLSDEMSLAFNRRHIGKIVLVLLENTRDGVFEGLTDNYIRVRARVDGAGHIASTRGMNQTRGIYAYVRVADADASYIYGRILESAMTKEIAARRPQ